ncbi:hypothetical protein [Aridibaculum aurantiacum]|uniref:hypothetical protein n=1 Tax=Aridibaculum aurantiacum TaxID=2810307 RepID=UPI001A97B885|nr:hypothetical protein [Aridibaculum aurantiacum]
MTKLYLLVSLLFFTTISSAQTIATTSDGRQVVLLPDGTWRYTFINQQGGQTTNLVDTYNKAYTYAYDVVYADEFFSSERRLKAQSWALDNMRPGISLPIGTKSLEQWFDELNSFAYDMVYKNEFFPADRRKKAATWAAQLLKESSWYEDFRLSTIDKHRMAYDLAYDRIFKEEMFRQERRRKALEWANEFVRR